MKSLYTLLLVLAIAAALFFKFGQQPYVSSFFPRAGQDPVSDSTLDKYFKAAQKRLDKNPKDLQSLVDQGIVYFMRGPDHYAQALNDFNQAWQNGALDKRIFYYSGILYENLSLFEEARKQYERFLNHEPKDYEIRTRLARLLLRMDLWQQSMDLYKEILTENPSDATTLTNCALASAKRYAQIKDEKNVDAAQISQLRQDVISYFEQALNTQATLLPEIFAVMANVYFDQDNFAKAIEMAEKALTQQEKPDAQILSILAQASEKNNDKTKALQAYSQLAQIQPSRKLQIKIRALKKEVQTTQKK